MTYVVNQDCFEFINSLSDKSVDLLLTDPPYYKIVPAEWDCQWTSVDAYVDWMFKLLEAAKPKLKDQASVIFFGGIGKHGERPFWNLCQKIETSNLYHYRNMITWGKKRAYGKSHDYLFCREEIVWYSMSSERKEVTFNIPLTNIKRGYAGFAKKYPAKSEFKRVTNVWTDIPELQRPSRVTEKPLELLQRLVKTHTNQGDVVIDPFSGTGSTGHAALSLGRRFKGSEKIALDAKKADDRCWSCVTLAPGSVIP